MAEALSSFVHANPTLSGLLVVTVLAGSGYLELRIFPNAPMLAGTSWFMGLLIILASLSALPISGWAGILFIVVWLGLGVGGMVWFLGRTTNISTDE